MMCSIPSYGRSHGEGEAFHLLSGQAQSNVLNLQEAKVQGKIRLRIQTEK